MTDDAPQHTVRYVAASDIAAAIERRKQRQEPPNVALARVLMAADAELRRRQASVDQRRAEQEERERAELAQLMYAEARKADVAGIYASTGYLPPLLRAIK